MGDVRVYRQPCLKRYTTKDGEARFSPNTRVITYRCKLHHPDAAEMAAIRAALAAGETKTAVAARFNVGTPQRLRRLLAKAPALEPAPFAPPALADAEVDAALAAAGWA